MRILYVEDDAADADLAQAEFRRSDPASSLEAAPTLAEARRRLGDGSAVDLVLVDLHLPDGNGLELLHEIRRLGLPVAVVILTSVGDEKTAVAALKGGADDYIAKRPGYATRLPTTLATALGRFREEARRRSGIVRVLYAEHHTDDVALTLRHLAVHAPHVRMEVVDSGKQVLRRLPDGPGEAAGWDVLMLDHRLPGQSALDVLKVLRDERQLDLPVVLVTGQGDEEVAAQALRLGATDYVVKNPNYLYALPGAIENAHKQVLLAREQAALRDSEARVSAIVASAMDAILAVDEEQRVVLFNPAAERMFRCQHEDALGSPLERFIPRQFRSRHRHHVEEFGRGEVVSRAMGELRMILGLRADGQEFPIEASISRARVGGMALSTVTLRDVTERAQRVQRLRESEERFRQLADHIDEVFWMTDPDKNQILYVSPGYQRIWGRTCESLLASPRDWLEAIHPDDRARVQEAVSRQVAGTFDEHYRIMRPDGSQRWIHDRAFPVRDEAGEVYRIAGVAEDVTAQRQAEAALRQSEEKFSKAFRSSPDALVLSRVSDGRLVEVNDAFVRAFGQSREQALLMTTHDLDAWISSCDRAEALAALLKRGSLRDWPLAFRDRAGVEHETLVSAEIIQLGDEALALTTVRDVSELRRAERDRSALEAQLRQSQKMEAIGRLAGGVAHDFNNMLNVILGYADLAQRKLSPVEPLNRPLAAIREAAERSADLTRQLLAFSRRQPIAPRVLDLNLQLGAMERLLHRVIGEDVALVLALAPEAWPVLMDPTQVDQIVANLAVNARDAMREGGRLLVETANVSVDAETCRARVGLRPGDYLLLRVTDTGHGMDEATRERAFEPFFTTKPEGTGTGLGLATVYGIVKQNEGFVHIDSEVGRGTTFQVYLPRHAGPEAPQVATAAASLTPGGDETILLVEDEAALRDIASALLQELGYEVLEAASPGDALAVAEAHAGDIALLLTDVVMPHMNGKELAKRVRALRPGTRTLFMSGYSAEAIGQRGVVDEGLHFLQKPFSLDSLARKVREVLGAPA